jgi:hypothetical protein
VSMFVAPVPDERSALLALLAQQRAGIRAAVHGLSDEQAAAMPRASGMSLLVRRGHAAAVRLVSRVSARSLPR